MSSRVRRLLCRPVAGLTLIAALAAAPTIGAQTPAQPDPTPNPPTAPPAAGDEETGRFFDAVTVSATLNASPVKDTPGTVSVIGAREIDRQLAGSVADLVRFEPGVYVETVPTGVGLNGFNIRGIGGNRVMTQIDGVETAEQFDFGPFNMHQQSLDLDVLKSAEIVRSAGSSLYGSDALGGVVSFFTKDPADYLAGRRFHAAAKTMFDGRSGQGSGNFVVAGGGSRAQVSLFVSHGRGHELGNKGDIRTEDATRTAPNAQDRHTTQVLGKAVFNLGIDHTLKAALETSDNDVDTLAYSLAGPTMGTDVSDVRANDTLARRRFSIEHTVGNRGGLDRFGWTAFLQQNDVRQVIDEVRRPSGAGAAATVNRQGTMEYEQQGYGVTVQARKAYTRGNGTVLFTAGGSFKRDTFDNLRDRIDINAATGAVVPTPLVLPSKYFPESHVFESGAYVQAEMRAGRLLVVPGVRVDRFSLDADEDDRVYLDSMNPVPSDFSAGAVSPKVGASFDVSRIVTLHAQYAGGFRAPPYTAVNSGFTNVLFGYVAVNNPDLRPERSDSFDFGLRAGSSRASVAVTGFVNLYADFIDMVDLGVNPATMLQEFQNQNIAQVTIRGIEIQGDAVLTDSLRVRASYAVIRGNDVSGDEDLPLTSIAPDQGAIGLQYTTKDGRWGGDLNARLARGQSVDRIGEGMFAPSAYGVVDAIAWLDLGRGLTLRGGVLNLTNATYYEWASVRGRSAGTATIERYTSPGISGVASLGYGW